MYVFSLGENEETNRTGRFPIDLGGLIFFFSRVPSLSDWLYSETVKDTSESWEEYFFDNADLYQS